MDSTCSREQGNGVNWEAGGGTGGGTQGGENLSCESMDKSAHIERGLGCGQEEADQ
ncbi:hypothetical protein I79_008521 [Cricetulus griseus]|uniref:Uncharacterized protein n=1 Tax=Cricetulus griseus TaxID=10029 RepID=G3HDH5_CRIGR|nr:hypothetical protein I79_008521 [Cricetulus griseus]